MSSQKLPVIIALQDGVSGVISWAFRLQEGFQGHPKYEVRLLFADKGMGPPSCCPTGVFVGRGASVSQSDGNESWPYYFTGSPARIRIR